MRLGLEQSGFEVVWSNDIDAAKHAMYVNNFGAGEGHEFALSDVGHVDGASMPAVDVAWASFPCTDLSLAGSRRGLAGSESGAFFHFARIVSELTKRPSVVALENVVGLATSRGGDDLRVAVSELNALGYSVDVITLDARRFVPQSRPRIFLVGSLEPVASGTPNDVLRPEWMQFVFDDADLRTHQAPLPSPPPPLSEGFSAAADRLAPGDPAWWDDERTTRFLDSLSDRQRARLERLRSGARISYRTMYRRTREGSAVWEIRADDLAGCLRTARGGSSKQAVVRAGRGAVRARWMTAHEYATLMGAPSYLLTGIRPLQAMFGFGDAVCVPVVQWIGEHYLMPLLDGAFTPRSTARAS